MVNPIKMERSTERVTTDERMAALIKGMLGRGDKQSDIAAFFGINSGRVAEINRHQTYQFTRAAPPRRLTAARTLRHAGCGVAV
jgi:hypothetical protein